MKSGYAIADAGGARRRGSWPSLGLQHARSSTDGVLRDRASAAEPRRVGATARPRPTQSARPGVAGRRIGSGAPGGAVRHRRRREADSVALAALAPLEASAADELDEPGFGSASAGRTLALARTALARTWPRPVRGRSDARCRRLAGPLTQSVRCASPRPAGSLTARCASMRRRSAPADPTRAWYGSCSLAGRPDITWADAWCRGDHDEAHVARVHLDGAADCRRDHRQSCRPRLPFLGSSARASSANEQRRPSAAGAVHRQLADRTTPPPRRMAATRRRLPRPGDAVPGSDRAASCRAS